MVSSQGSRERDGGSCSLSLRSLLTCSAKNLDCCDVDRSRMASTRDQACGCSWTAFRTASAAARWGLRECVCACEKRKQARHPATGRRGAVPLNSAWALGGPHPLSPQSCQADARQPNPWGGGGAPGSRARVGAPNSCRGKKMAQERVCATSRVSLSLSPSCSPPRWSRHRRRRRPSGPGGPRPWAG